MICKIHFREYNNLEYYKVQVRTAWYLINKLH